MDAEDCTSHVTRSAAAVEPNRHMVADAQHGAACVAARCGLMCFEAGHPPSNRKVAGSITVMIASSRQPLLSVWVPRLMHEPGVELHAEPLADPAHLGASLGRQLPAVLLLDKALLDRLDARSLRTIHANCERTRVLLLWDEFCNGLVVDILRHHFHGFLLTTCPSEMWLKAIRAVSRGELWLSRAALAKAIAELLPASSSIDAAEPPQPARSDATHTLTRREQQIVELLRHGCSNKEIAHELGVMEDTVKKHLQSVFGKLGVHRRALVALCPQPSATNLAS